MKLRGEDKWLVISVSGSWLKELIVDCCLFLAIKLLMLLILECLACLTNYVELQFSASVPRLGHVNLSFFDGVRRGHDELSCFLKDTHATITILTIRLTGPKWWIVPWPLAMKLKGLRKLLIADVPSSWDVMWTRVLLMAVLALEIMHIHMTPSEPYDKSGREISWLGVVVAASHPLDGDRC